MGQQGEKRPCVVCQLENAKFLFRPKLSPGPIVRCLNCGMVYVSPLEDTHALIIDGPVLGDADPNILISNTLKDVEGCWELSILREKAEEWFAYSRNTSEVLNRIDQTIEPLGRILDFGCGCGFFLGEARKRGWSIYGLEPLPAHAIYARSIFGAKVITDILRENVFPPDFFDIITAFQVFEHLPDPNKDLAILYRFLRPGGVILIEVPNIDTLTIRIFGRYHRHFVQDHVNFFSYRTLRMLLEKNNFQFDHYYFPTRYMSMHHLLEGWLCKFLPKFLSIYLKRISQNKMMYENVVGINLRDIVTVVAKKPE